MQWIYEQEVTPEINGYYKVCTTGGKVTFAAYRKDGWRDDVTNKRIFACFYVPSYEGAECGGEAFYTWEYYENAYPFAVEYRHYMKSKTAVAQYIIRGAGYPSLPGGYLSLCVKQYSADEYYIRVYDADDMEWES